MIIFFPLRKIHPNLYWKLEGLFFHWLLAMVSMWSWSAGYDSKYNLIITILHKNALLLNTLISTQYFVFIISEMLSCSLLICLHVTLFQFIIFFNFSIVLIYIISIDLQYSF